MKARGREEVNKEEIKTRKNPWTSHESATAAITGLQPDSLLQHYYGRVSMFDD